MSTDNCDVIVVLGGGLDVQGQLIPRNFSRLDTAVELFKLGVARHIIVSGGWSFLTQKPSVTEAEQMRHYAVEKGVPDASMHTEDQSHETLGQALLTKTRFLEPYGWSSLALVTSKSHMPRSVRIFKHVLGENYRIHPVSAPEKPGTFEKVWESIGGLLVWHVLRGTEPGDDETIWQRLTQLIPEYQEGGQSAGTALKHIWRIIKRLPASSS